MLELKNVKKVYVVKNEKVMALNDVSYTFEMNNFYGIMGHSGSGKTTLISILGLLESFDSGTYLINGEEVKDFDNNKISKIRRDYVGFVFQDFYLDEYLNVYENVMLPLITHKELSKETKNEMVIEALTKVGIVDRKNHFPSQLSGGEKQRVAIARALINNPKIILADEPTGNLDEDNEKMIFQILKDLSKEGKCVIVVSHSNEVKSYADKIIKIANGKLVK
ncbi:aBC transporter related protein [Coprobacillus sp. CAG:605]|jgi:putative ABC transport system ATP-binding protein|nr:aBC transporter related protein [Coprobacillus sp. CAG:605]